MATRAFYSHKSYSDGVSDLSAALFNMKTIYFELKLFLFFALINFPFVLSNDEKFSALFSCSSLFSCSFIITGTSDELATSD